MEPFLTKVKYYRLSLLKNFPSKNRIIKNELLNTVISHIELFNRRIMLVDKQLALAQKYIDFFEQREIVFIFLRKEGFIFKIKPFKNKLKFKNRQQAVDYKKKKELQLLKYINARSYFFTAANLLYKYDRKSVRLEIRGFCKKNLTVNKLMRAFLKKKLLCFYFFLISFFNNFSIYDYFCYLFF